MPTRGAVPNRISLGLATGALLQPLNSSMIAVALITIGSQLAIEDGISWLVSGLYLATAVAAPTAGRLAELHGPRRVFFGGLVLVAVGSAVGPLWPTLPGLIVSRVVLGLGTASQFPAALAIIRERAAHRAEDASRALGVLGVSAQLSIALGPALGGLLVTELGWPAIFWVNLPLCVLTGLWVWRVTDSDDRKDRPARSTWTRLDPVGIVLFAIMLCTAMRYLLSLAGGEPWWDEWWWLVVAVVAAIAWLGWERRAPEPFVDLAIFAQVPRLGLVLIRQLLVSTAFFCVFYAAPQWLEEQRGLDPRTAGLLIMPIAVVGAASTLLANRLLRRGLMAPTVIIGATSLIGGGLLITFGISSATAGWALPVLLGVLGIPGGFNFQSNQNEVYALAGPRVGTAAGLLRTAHFLGAMVSAGLIEVLSAGTYDDAALHRVGLAIVVLAGLLLVVGLLGIRSVVEGQPRSSRRR